MFNIWCIITHDCWSNLWGTLLTLVLVLLALLVGYVAVRACIRAAGNHWRRRREESAEEDRAERHAALYAKYGITPGGMVGMPPGGMAPGGMAPGGMAPFPTARPGWGWEGWEGWEGWQVEHSRREARSHFHQLGVALKHHVHDRLVGDRD